MYLSTEGDFPTPSVPGIDIITPPEDKGYAARGSLPPQMPQPPVHLYPSPLAPKAYIHYCSLFLSHQTIRFGGTHTKWYTHKAVQTKGGAYTRRCLYKAVHTKGGLWPLQESCHLRGVRGLAPASSKASRASSEASRSTGWFVGPQAWRCTHNVVHKQGGAHTRRFVATTVGVKPDFRWAEGPPSR